MPRENAFNLVVNMPTIGSSFKEALVAWKKSITKFPEEYGGEPRTECLGFDFLEPGPNSRIRIYTRLWKASYSALAYYWSLGGLLQDETTRKGQELLKIFWQIVFDVVDEE